ncbi:MAG: hypothetical protein RR829_06825 [Oscillospiraceae bacterium]
MTKHGHRAAVHDNEIRMRYDANEEENSSLRVKIKGAAVRHRYKEITMQEAKKYESEEKE